LQGKLAQLLRALRIQAEADDQSFHSGMHLAWLAWQLGG